MAGGGRGLPTRTVLNHVVGELKLEPEPATSQYRGPMDWTVKGTLWMLNHAMWIPAQVS